MSMPTERDRTDVSAAALAQCVSSWAVAGRCISLLLLLLLTGQQGSPLCSSAIRSSSKAQRKKTKAISRLEPLVLLPEPRALRFRRRELLSQLLVVGGERADLAAELLALRLFAEAGAAGGLAVGLLAAELLVVAIVLRKGEDGEGEEGADASGEAWAAVRREGDRHRQTRPGTRCRLFVAGLAHRPRQRHGHLPQRGGAAIPPEGHRARRVGSAHLRCECSVSKPLRDLARGLDSCMQA